MTLAQDGIVVAKGVLPKFIPRQPAEKLCLGHDAQMPVAAYPRAVKFIGELGHLSIESP